MILQRIVFPLPGQTEAAALYYRGSEGVQPENRYEICIPRGGRLGLCTYFNAFSARRWKRFALIKEVVLSVKAAGGGQIRLMYADKYETVCIQEQRCLAEEKSDFLFPVRLTDRAGFYYLEAEAGQDRALTLYNAGFETYEPGLRPVRIALVICTFHREGYVCRNLRRIREEILENGASALQKRLDIYVIDNGRTLSEAELEMPGCKLIRNANTGGSGGFTRGMMEVLGKKESRAYTHVLLMDDDVAFDPESLERTYTLLCYVREKYLGSVVGGAMLRSDRVCILEEAGAKWPGKLESLGRGLELTKREALLRYDSIGNAEYQAWWYCCIPLSIVNLNNLPLPFFIHGDDVEYGLRNYQYVLQLNGICVWHDTFENKRPSHLEYYDVRNQLIVNALHDRELPLAEQLLELFKRGAGLIFRMRYPDVRLVIRGVEDFLKGPDWWRSQEAARLHQEILNEGYAWRQYPQEALARAERPDETAAVPAQKRIWCFLSLNGAFFPKKKTPVLIPCGSNPFVLYRRKEAYLREPVSGKTIHVRFSFREMAKAYCGLFGALFRLLCRYPRIKIQYRRMAGFLGSMGYWKKYADKE